MQNLTPLEIQKATFSRKFKGYNVDEVRGYLYLVAEEIEQSLAIVRHLGRKVRRRCHVRHLQQQLIIRFGWIHRRRIH